jgi:hypothetical protein
MYAYMHDNLRFFVLFLAMRRGYVLLSDEAGRACGERVRGREKEISFAIRGHLYE